MPFYKEQEMVLQSIDLPQVALQPDWQDVVKEVVDKKNSSAEFWVSLYSNSKHTVSACNFPIDI
jgi:hypothetical protein